MSVPRPQQEGKPAPAGVGDDPGRHLEDDLPESEEGIDRERLRVVETRVEQEQRIDAPDERSREGHEQGQDEVRTLDRAGRGGHRGRMLDALA